MVVIAVGGGAESARERESQRTRNIKIHFIRTYRFTQVDRDTYIQSSHTQSVDKDHAIVYI